MEQKKRAVNLARVELRDALDGGHPKVVVDGNDLGPSCLGYAIERQNMATPPVLVVRIACGRVNDESLIEVVRPEAVAS